MKAWILKAAIPVLLVAGGITAWAMTRPGDVTTPTAWIDAPIAGAVFATGPVSVQAHGSAPGGVDRVELAVDGTAVASAAPTGDDRLAVVTIPWNGAAGWHTLTVRAKAGGTWGPSSTPVPVTIGAPGDAATDTTKPGSTTPSDTARTDTSTTSTSSLPDETTTTESTIPGETTVPTTTRPGRPDPATPTTRPPTTRPPTTRPPVTARPTIPLPPLVPPAVSASSDWAYQGDPVRLTAISMLDGAYTLTIEVRPPGGSFRTIVSCSGSPCRTEYAFPTIGLYQYRATVTQGGRSASSAIASIQIRGNEA